MKWKIGLIASLGLSLVSISEASAGLTPSYIFNGVGEWTIDGVGSNSTPVGTITLDPLPAGYQVEKAFLYSTKIFGDTGAPTVVLESFTYNPSDFTPLGITNSLQAHRVDVTSDLAPLITGGQTTFTVNSENPNLNTDGEVLAVIYSKIAPDPTDQVSTIAFLDGFSEQTGDSVTVNFANPINPSLPGFKALLSLGIGYSFQPGGQVSQVDINGDRLTSSAGGQDDGIPITIGNGGLITVGGTGDSPNLPDPFAPATSVRTDDEYYDLALGSFLSINDTFLLVETLNPSNDDNIFFLGLNITAEADVCVGPECEKVPEPSSILGLITLGILGAGVKLKKK